MKLLNISQYACSQCLNIYDMRPDPKTRIIQFTHYDIEGWPCVNDRLTFKASYDNFEVELEILEDSHA